MLGGSEKMESMFLGVKLWLGKKKKLAPEGSGLALNEEPEWMRQILSLALNPPVNRSSRKP
jgi:hypothetical protein